jgi:hypothetical protein
MPRLPRLTAAEAYPKIVKQVLEAIEEVFSGRIPPV